MSTWHKSITTKRLVRLIKRRDTTLANPGICIRCGKGAEGCEPDAREYRCEYCDKLSVYAPEELLISGTLR